MSKKGGNKARSKPMPSFRCGDAMVERSSRDLYLCISHTFSNCFQSIQSINANSNVRRLVKPPVRSSSTQFCGDFREKLSIQSQIGFATPLQTVKGPHVADGVQGSTGWAYMACQVWLASDQTVTLIWPEMSSEANEDDDSSGEVYMLYSSSSLSTYNGTKSLVRGSNASMDLIIGISFNEDFDCQDQYTTEGSRRFRTTPLVSSTTLYEPKPGSIRLFLEMPCRIKPVTLFQPNLAPGRRTSVG